MTEMSCHQVEVSVGLPYMVYFIRYLENTNVYM